ncbi:hypothetical protein [Sorangium cellulosum]|nr:hypothetical protein [Sorangium cellulosum]
MATLVQGPIALAALSFALTLLLAGPVLAQAPAPRPPPGVAPHEGPRSPEIAAPGSADLLPPDREADMAAPVAAAPPPSPAAPATGAPAAAEPTGSAPPVMTLGYDAPSFEDPAFDAPPVKEPADGALPAARGVQMAVRSGYAIPMGDATGAGADELSSSFGGQVPVLIEVGVKSGDSVFFGLYAGLGFGGPGSAADAQCSSSGLSCDAQTFRIGPEVQVHLHPAGKVNPWLGYGLGLEISTISMRGPGGNASMSLMGVELAHLMAGVDFRLSSALGAGPVLDLSLAQYSSMTMELNGVEVPGASGQIAETALHAWLSLGARLVLFP